MLADQLLKKFMAANVRQADRNQIGSQKELRTHLANPWKTRRTERNMYGFSIISLMGSQLMALVHSRKNPLYKL